MNHYGPHLVPLSLDTSVAGNKLPVPEGIIGLRLDGMPPGVMLGIFERGAQEPARILLPGSSYHFESEECIPDRIEVMTPVLGTAYLTGWRRGVVLLGGSPNSNNGRSLSLFPETDPVPYGAAGATDGDVVFFCPPDRRWELLHAFGVFTTSAVVGTRLPAIAVQSRKGTVLGAAVLTAALAASLSKNIRFYNNLIGNSFTRAVIPPGGQLRYGVGIVPAEANSAPALAGDLWSQVSALVLEYLEV